MKPEIISTRTIHEGRVFNVTVAEIVEDGHKYTREMVVHPGSAVIIPVYEDRTVALVRQYRHAAGAYLLEFPAGALSPGEEPAAGAARELEEEVGVRAEKIEKLTEFFVSPGFLDEKMNVFLATGLTETAQNLDEDEFLSVERLHFEELFDMIRRNEIPDAKTIIGAITAGARFGFVF